MMTREEKIPELKLQLPPIIYPLVKDDLNRKGRGLEGDRGEWWQRSGGRGVGRDEYYHRNEVIRYFTKSVRQTTIQIENSCYFHHSCYLTKTVYHRQQTYFQYGTKQVDRINHH